MLNSRLTGLIWQIDIPMSLAGDEESVHLDLGSGLRPRNPFCARTVFTSDIADIQNDASFIELTKQRYESLNFDLTMPFPIESDSFDSFSAYDVIEHLPRWERVNNRIRFPFVEFMQEVYRCLKPGGFFLAVTPYFPHTSSFMDPTHVNYISRETVDYFCSSDLILNLTSSYGFSGKFDQIYCAPLKGPGPFLEANQLMSSIRNQGSLLIYLLKFSKRIFQIMVKRKCTHILWVLRKPY